MKNKKFALTSAMFFCLVIFTNYAIAVKYTFYLGPVMCDDVNFSIIREGSSVADAVLKGGIPVHYSVASHKGDEENSALDEAGSDIDFMAGTHMVIFSYYTEGEKKPNAVESLRAEAAKGGFMCKAIELEEEPSPFTVVLFSTRTKQTIDSKRIIPIKNKTIFIGADNAGKSITVDVIDRMDMEA